MAYRHQLRSPSSGQAGRVGGLQLSGTHVVLVPLEPSHAPALARAAAGDRSTFGLTWVPDGPDDAERYVAKALADRDAGTAVPFATTRAADGEVLGSTRFMNIERWPWDLAGPDPDAVEIGSTWLAPSAQRTPGEHRGQAADARRTRSRCGTCTRVTLKTDARNERSRNAILRLGAQFDGVLRAHMPAYDGAWPRDSAFYSILASEWPAVRSGLRTRLGIPDDPGGAALGSNLCSCSASIRGCRGAATRPSTRRVRSPCARRSACSPLDLSDPLPRRLAELRGELHRLIAELTPDVVVVEHVFFQVNVRTAMSVGQASGLALAEAASVGCEVVQYTPNQVKEAVVGYGAATKAQVQRLVQARLNLAAPPSPPDAADAAALALCHLAWAPWRARLERA